MKIAVMFCIHGNYKALNAVLSDIDDHNVGRVYCLSDLVGYGPRRPNATWVIYDANSDQILLRGVEYDY